MLNATGRNVRLEFLPMFQANSLTLSEVRSAPVSSYLPPISAPQSTASYTRCHRHHPGHPQSLPLVKAPSTVSGSLEMPDSWRLGMQGLVTEGSHPSLWHTPEGTLTLPDQPHYIRLQWCYYWATVSTILALCMKVIHSHCFWAQASPPPFPLEVASQVLSILSHPCAFPTVPQLRVFFRWRFHKCLQDWKHFHWRGTQWL